MPTVRWFQRICRHSFSHWLFFNRLAGFTIGLVFAVEGLASLNVKQDEPERAAQLFAWADNMREKIGDRRPPIEQASVDRDIVVIRSQLGDTAFKDARKRVDP